MPFHTKQLPNGLTLLGESSPSAQSVALGFFVRTGSRDEQPEESGVSHFLEHMMFKGTERRSAAQVNLDFDRIGADYNAYTSEENTVFHAAVLPEYLPQTVDILADILRPSLREDDFLPEKDVILTEIARYEDQPSHILYERCRQLYFGSHPLGNSVLGTPASIVALTRDQMAAYFSRRYAPGNITVAITGQFEWERFVDLVATRCAGWPGVPVSRAFQPETRGPGKLEVCPSKKWQQEYVLWMLAGPPTESPLRYAADLLSLAIGDDPGGRLYWEIIDPGLAEGADMSYQESEGAGIYYFNLLGDPDKAGENVARVENVMAEVQRDNITSEELEQARVKHLSRLVRQAERPKGRLSALAYTWMYQQELRTLDDELAAFRAVTLDSVRELLDRYPLAGATTVAVGPLEQMAR